MFFEVYSHGILLERICVGEEPIVGDMPMPAGMPDTINVTNYNWFLSDSFSLQEHIIDVELTVKMAGKILAVFLSLN